MINGSLVAPFRHDSTWPDEVLRWFRSAVYYLHKPVTGRDSINQLRELISYKERDGKPKQLSNEWMYLKTACNTIVHGAIDRIKDEEMTNLSRNLLVFANLLLIQDYGLETHGEMRISVEDPKEEAKHEASRKGASRQFLANINHAFESLETSIEKLRQKDGRLRGPLTLENAEVTSFIPSVLPFVKPGAYASKISFIVEVRSTEACEYEFHPEYPIGWVMTGGNPSNDRFADDGMSSSGVFASGTSHS